MTNEEALKIWLPIIKMGVEPIPECNEALNMAIKALEQEPKWIPVSERLPEKSGRYLAYIINPYDDKLRYSMTCYFTSEVWCPDDECASDNVVAWMPLPEEYNPESEE